jgi:DNA mismatch endonuclease (patch repair protein)
VRSSIIGKPDIVIRKLKLIIFVDGEFWHGFDWERKKKSIKNNQAYWVKKIEGNIQRDIRTTETLTSNGWTVLRFWANEVIYNLDTCLKRIQTVSQRNSGNINSGSVI